MSQLTPEQAEAKWVLLADDLHELRRLVNFDQYHISFYAEELFNELRAYYASG